MIDPITPDYTNTPVSSRRPHFGYALAPHTASPCVTIVTPFYNPGPVFHETVRSVLQQSLQEWEWLIVNDGSTDPESLAILEEYRDGDARIRIIDHDTNQGLSTARNTGFRAAQTAYVVQLDSDDLLEPTAVEKWLWFLTSYPEFSFVKGYTVGFGAQEYLWQKGFHNGSAFLDENLVAPTSMVCTAVHEAVGGYDESIVHGLEDWDYWLRCASHGYWGSTIPEYLDWYRRRTRHSERWTNWDNGEHQRAFHARLRRQYRHLWNGGFPHIQPRWHMPYDSVPETLPCENRLGKDKPRLLLIVPWLTLGGADQFNLHLLEQLTRRGWEITIATTKQGEHAWLPHFARYTPDIFILHHFLRLVDYPRFLRYLIRSRQVDVVLISHSELGYLLLPYLRAHCPEVTFTDFCHIEEEYWNNGGYPRMAVEYQEMLDLHLVTSKHLKGWMVQRGADPQRIQVCYINVDPEAWCPDPRQRATVRQELGVDETTPLVLYTGRICEQKQPRVLAHTLLQLCQQQSRCMGLIAGDGPELEWLRSFLKRQGLGARIRLLGEVSHERVRALMTAADIFFLPSKWEGIALTLYEAMACGLPVVGADVGGQGELVTPECGVLLTRSEEEETEARLYAAILAQLLDNPQRRQAMGQAGRQRVSTSFRLEQMGERMASLLQEAMRLHQTQARPISGLGLGRACAIQAVEYVRLFNVADGLWQERKQAEHLYRYPHLLDPHNDSWRMLAYFAIRRLLLPYYRALLNRNMQWLMVLKNRLKYSLLRGVRHE